MCYIIGNQGSIPAVTLFCESLFMLLLFAFKCCSLIYPNYTLINNSVFDNKFIEKNITKDSYLFISDKMDQKNHKISRIIIQNIVTQNLIRHNI